MRPPVNEAIVTFPKKGGRGVLVPGSLIITAAHCISTDLTGGMVLGDDFTEEIRTAAGVSLKVAPVAVEPLSDIAALGSLDDQVFPDDAEAFDRLCATTKAVPVSRAVLRASSSFRVRVSTQNGKWVDGTATCVGGEDDPERLWLTTRQKIRPGDSGSPVINDSGELIGIVSNVNITAHADNGYGGPIPRPHLALPMWVSRKWRGLRDPGVRRFGTTGNRRPRMS